MAISRDAPLFFHGQPGNRLFRHPDDALTSSLGVRLICIDRPGYGLSDFQLKRRLVDWPADVCALADALEIGKFSVLGFSAGGPYALACAHRIPERLIQVGAADSAPPMHLSEIYAAATSMIRINCWLTRHAPSAMNSWFRLFWRFSRRKPDTFLRMAGQQAGQVDKFVLSQPDIFAVLQEVWKENIRVDSLGYAYDTQILMKDWGFQLNDIQKEIYLWQGEADADTPSAWGHYFANELPNCRATFIPNAGHFAIFIYWKEILQTLMIE